MSSPKSKVKGFAVPYHFSISITGGFVFRLVSAEACFHVVYYSKLD